MYTADDQSISLHCKNNEMSDVVVYTHTHIHEWYNYRILASGLHYIQSIISHFGNTRIHTSCTVYIVCVYCFPLGCCQWSKGFIRIQIRL